ncbi:MAG: putative outer rane lipoprotein SlyB precursor [Phenylobacterium sp.]|nr:putative outer rane lipoprotein SlyB precursor [Phenylobacterium sp.]
MRRMLFAAGLTLAVAASSAAQARSGCAAAAHDRRVTGTVVGALGGGLLGSAVAGHGSKGTGALVGAGLGAVVGNQLSRTSCDRYAYRRSYHSYARARTYGPAYGRGYGPGYGPAYGQNTPAYGSGYGPTYASGYGQNNSAYAPNAPGYPRYATSGGACHYVTRPYYDQAGRLVYAPMQVCE